MTGWTILVAGFMTSVLTELLPRPRQLSISNADGLFLTLLKVVQSLIVTFLIDHNCI